MKQQINQPKKVLIFDSGPIINFSMNGLLYLIEKLKENFSGSFIITNDVKKEIYDRPITIQRFELEALRIKKLLDDKVLELPESIGIKNQDLEATTLEIMTLANKSFQTRGKFINILSKAETSCLALSRELRKRGIENIIAIDERTARIIGEKPENLEKLMSKKLHNKVTLVNNKIKEMKEFKFIRSSELVYVAHKKNLTKIKDKKALEALLYATKYKGASISWDEVNVLKKL